MTKQRINLEESNGFNRSINGNIRQNSSSGKTHLMAVSNTDLQIQIYPINFTQPFTGSKPITQYKVKNRKRTTSLKFFENSLFSFSSELISVYDIDQEKIKQTKDIEKMILAAKILMNNGLIACNMKNDWIKILDSKTLNVIERFHFEDELTSTPLVQIDEWSILVSGINTKYGMNEKNVLKLYDLRHSSKAINTQIVEDKITCLDVIDKQNILAMGHNIQVRITF